MTLLDARGCRRPRSCLSVPTLPLRTAIQIEADQQRYSIPEKEAEERELARRVGYQHTPETDALVRISEGLPRPHRTACALFSRRLPTTTQSNPKKEFDISRPAFAEEDPKQTRDVS